MKVIRSLAVLAFATGVALLAGCGGGTNKPVLPPVSGTVAVLGTDAPLDGVVAFQITISGLTASDGTNTVPIFSGSQQIEFSRLNGLRTLLSLQTVPAGSYTSITATLASPVISFLDTSVSPPKINTIAGSLTQSSVTVLLNQPLVVTDGGVVGLLFDFRLRDSLEVGPSGQLTGNVVPNLSIRAIPPDAPEAEIDELRGGVASVDVPGKKFVMQLAHGRQLTVVTNDQTNFEDNEGLEQLDTNTIVQVSGSLQRNSLTLTASEVIILTKDHFLLGGLLTDVRPASGTANEVDLLVRTELPDLSTADVGQISTLGFDGNERFMIQRLRLPISVFLFNRDSLVRGQRISAGGVLSNAANPPTLDVRRVWLHPQGVEGTLVPGSVDPSSGTFLLTTRGLTGVLFGQPVKVFTSPLTRFTGISGFSALSGTTAVRLRVVGLVLLDHSSGDPVIIARAVHVF